MDTFLKNWAAKNVTVQKTNNVQALADSFGAPNFFCGIDNFCNAGQPCLPVQLPAWYAMVAIQNWNSYMNSINTAIIFASSIVSLTLPGQHHAAKQVSTLFTTALSVIPLTGAVSQAAGVAQTGLSYLTGNLKVPESPNLFLKWSQISDSLATVVTEYQASVSTSLKTTLDAKVDDATSGIDTTLKGGQFLGIAQNFTQNDLQKLVTGSITIYSIGLALQAQKVFIYRFYPDTCPDDSLANRMCITGSGSGSQNVGYTMTKSDDNGNALSQSDSAKLLVDKYGLAKAQVLQQPAECFDLNGKKQLTNSFGASLPLDKTTKCIFNLLVCDQGSGQWDQNKGIVDNCRNNGLDV
ncbi:hypothetical protein IFR04_012615 [Cadophora malorum]|uniref:DUF7872 domain-containing protein n=1 Tax=Cadophora malorum TaxID=108018 RepID=A0A8H7T8J5_9HELO|nr:hypothetical protein IFR04_012615 [Cadophora malorum]